MINEPLKISLEANKAVIKFEGEVNFENSNQLKEKVKAELITNEEVDVLIIDLAQVSYLDSSGVGLLLSLFKFMQKRDGSLKVVNPNAKLKRVFDVTKMREIIPVFTDLDKALAES
ncbi:STAS domain-containing protein [Halanaerobium praevalens]|uniref:Anti-sigma factor antagonist n=1 Tax=Halanaerobium praevalens (strain ATCC 33744 / DSM 2228 / GSL) TaxID=572479 RepID=E3DNV1_HALPG|nr:STAS domain-containing protein [Halanaerobium praevalens]ADO76575.1 anti-sigma-factor antagonist [Halanaerobium praevalens DSM 2228]